MSPNSIFLAFCGGVLLSLAAAAQVPASLPEIKATGDGKIKAIRIHLSRRNGDEWAHAIELASNSDTRIYIAQPELNDGIITNSIRLTGWQQYAADVVVSYRNKEACLRASTQDNARCEAGLQQAERIDANTADLTAIVRSTEDAPESYDRPGPRPRKRLVLAPVQQLDALHAAAVEQLNRLAMQTFPEAGQPRPPIACSGDPIPSASTPRPKGQVSAPALASKKEPDYSEEARRRKLNGEVVLRLIVREDGTPDCFSIMRPLSFGLNEQAINAVKRWRFRPATRDGQPVPVELNVAVNFQIF